MSKHPFSFIVSLFWRSSTLVLQSTRRSGGGGGGAWTPAPNTTPALSPSYREALLEVVNSRLPDPPGYLQGGPGGQHLSPPLPHHLLTVRLFWRWSFLVSPIHKEILWTGWLVAPLTSSTPSPPYRDALLEVVHPGLPDPPGDLGTSLAASA
jgi:hypothetical protein